MLCVSALSVYYLGVMRLLNVCLFYRGLIIILIMTLIINMFVFQDMTKPTILALFIQVLMNSSFVFVYEVCELNVRCECLMS